MDARSRLHLYEHKCFVLQGNTMHQHLTWPVLGLGLNISTHVIFPELLQGRYYHDLPTLWMSTLKSTGLQ